MDKKNKDLRNQVVMSTKKKVRGGKRDKTVVRSAQYMLLDAIWKKFLGPSAVAEILGVGVQTPLNWRIRGAVPLEEVISVANKLGIKPHGLNYEGCRLIADPNKKYPSWEEVVGYYGLEKRVVRAILKEGVLA